MCGGVVIVNVCLLHVPFDGSVQLFIGIDFRPSLFYRLSCCVPLLLGVENVMHIRLRMCTSVRSLRKFSVFLSSFCTFTCKLKSCCCISCMYCGCSWLVIDSSIFAMVCFASWIWISSVLLRSSAVFVLAACFFAVCGVDACIVLSSIFLRFSFL